MNNKQIKVLMIEDNPGHTRLIREMLTEAKGVNFDLECTDRLLTGLKRIDTGGMDVILCDLSLPDSHGLNTFTEVHKKALGLPIIVLSNLDDEELAVKAVQEGAQDYLVKGYVDSNLLVRSIRYAIERKQVEEALCTSTQRWQTTFDTIKDSICILDLERRIVQCNKATQSLLEKPLEYILGHECCNLIHDSSETIEECPFVHMQKTLQRENVVMQSEDRWLNISVDPIINKEGNLIGAVHIVGDITERKMAEEQLIQSEKLAGIGMLASGIAHEINNPLSGIMGYAEILMEEDNQNQTKKFAQKILNEAVRTANIIKWLSKYTRQAKDSNITEVDLKGVIEEALEALKHTRKYFDIEIVKDHKKIPNIKGNKSELQQVFVNLMNNAVDAMPNGGRLSLSTAIAGNYIEARISDSGIGIAREKIKKIFDPFFTTKEVGEGTGLGLYVTSMIIKKHHGTIKVDSEVGKGTNFTLRFPKSEVKC